MQTYLLHVGATITCAHGGLPLITSPDSRVLVGGLPVLVQTATVVVSGCPSVTRAGEPSPCLTAHWVTAATRITSNGMPLLLDNSISVCSPNATPLVILNTQKRVLGI
jgi:hypothetical protein